MESNLHFLRHIFSPLRAQKENPGVETPGFGVVDKSTSEVPTSKRCVSLVPRLVAQPGNHARFHHQ